MRDKVTVYTLFMKPTTTLFRKIITTMGLTVLFTYLKIIFFTMFLVFSKISCIQIDPIYKNS